MGGPTRLVCAGPEIGKEYYTVNPVAINSPVNVLTENKRKVHIIDSPQFGKVGSLAVAVLACAPGPRTASLPAAKRREPITGGDE
eukprot:2490159-Pyramimonas_sp.AAC.1